MADSNNAVKVVPETIEQKLARLERENAELKAKAEGSPKVLELKFKVSEKKAVQINGFGRFPVTLYWEQWERLIGPADDEKNLGYVLALKKFIRENKAELSSKPKV